MKKIAVLVLVGCWAWGCAGDDGGATIDRAASCPGGVAPPLASCVAGELFADCGGTGSGVLACSGGVPGRCTWFATGCVAEGFVASTCPADDLCCDDAWPYANGAFADALFPFLDGAGVRPWDRARAMNVTLAIDPALPATAPGYRCEGTDPFAGGASPCATIGARVDPAATVTRAGAIVAFTLPANGIGFSGWYPLVEIDPAAGRARVCTYRFVDYAVARCPATIAPVCASSGTLTLSALPTSPGNATGLHGALDARLGTLHLLADF